MMQIRCPKCNNASTDADYCSECGSKITADPISAVIDPQESIPGDASKSKPIKECPDCGEVRPTVTTRFCNNCRYDFVNGKSFSVTPNSANIVVDIAMVSPVNSVSPISQASPTIPVAQEQKDLLKNVNIEKMSDVSSHEGEKPVWEVVVKIDHDRKLDGYDPAPDLDDRFYKISQTESLVGRHVDKEGFFPDISLFPDRGCSKRHGLLRWKNGDDLAFQDTGSSNGTRLNGKDISAHVWMPLKIGDVLEIGLWTSLEIRKIGE